ncbi:ribonuclease E inhibitor RraB [Lysobacter capsici]|uniref:ribonuclease E inhibitor RraB n=1 Tax=Lysobacter capsici TaxID=435897 RepID=UPI00177C84DE|nr:ribonuclease E inhibitor RraB [Lysobacter capsici]UOF14260.1 ribonuclease E inhibitor RraB [Lysobacter capsici]
MKNTVQTLMDTAAADTELLQVLDQQGDHFALSRDVEFVLRAPSEERASLVAGFFNDLHYGDATVGEHEGLYSVFVTVHTTIEQPVILSISGFITCISQLYDMEYDGWSCAPQISKAIAN